MKKALSFMLALVMCLGLAVTSVHAGGITDPQISIKIGSDMTTNFNPQTQTTPLSGSGWSYDPNTKTLTLENFNGEYLGIYRGGKITLELKGSNVITDVRFLGAGIAEDHSVTIIGDGSLTASNIIISISVVQTSATITTTDKSGKQYGLYISAGDNTSFHMTGGTLNATGRSYGIQADTPQGQILLEGGTVTAQGGAAAIWCQYIAPPERTTDILNVGGRAIIGGETVGSTQIMSIKTASISYEYPSMGIPNIKTKYFTSLSAKDLMLEEDYFSSNHAKNSGAAKYIHIADASQPQQPTTPTETSTGTALASTQTVTVDGKAVEFQMYALKDANGNLTNYIKLRDMAYVLNGTKAQFAVGYDGTISLTTGQSYTAGGTEMTTPFSGDRAYKGGAQSVKINGASVNMTAITLTDDDGGGYNYFKLRDLGKALGFYVGYSNEAGIYIDSTKPYSE